MAIQMRRGNEADLDISKLKAGEIAICLDTQKMIVKLTGSNYLTLSDMPELSEMVNSKADVGHNHDDRYYTEGEIDEKLSNLTYSDMSHNHDDRYYTESEIDTKLNSLTFADIAYSGAMESVDNFNKYSTSGIWKVNFTKLKSNAPSSVMNAGLLIVLGYYSPAVIQIFFHFYDQSIYIRAYSDSNWGSWQKISAG